MAKHEKYTCDICKAERGEANHWFRASINGKALFFTTWHTASEPKEFHLCGQVCAHKLLDQFLSGTLV